MVVHRPQRSRTFPKKKGPQQAPPSKKFHFGDLKRLVKNPLPILPAILKWFAAPAERADSPVRSHKFYKSFLDTRASLPFPHAISLGDSSHHQTSPFRFGGASVLAEQFYEGSAHFATWSQTFPTGSNSVVSEGSGSGESDGSREDSSDGSCEGSSSGTSEESLNAPKGIFPSTSGIYQRIQDRSRFRQQFVKNIFKERAKILRAQEGQAKRIAEFARRDARLLKAMHQSAEEEEKRQVEEAKMRMEQERRLHDAGMTELVKQSIREEQEKQELLRGRWEALRQQEIEFQNRVERENAEIKQGNMNFRRMRWNHPYTSMYTQENFMRDIIKRREEDEGRLKATKEKLTRQTGLRPQELREELDEERKQESRRRQEELRQEALRQEELRQEALRQEALRQEELRREALRQEALKQEALKQEALKQEALKQEALKQEALKQEALKQEALKQEALKQEALRQEALRREALRREALRQEALRREEALRQEALKQEALKQSAEAYARARRAPNPLKQILEMYDLKWSIIGEKDKRDARAFGWAEMPFPLFQIPPIGASNQITLDNVREFLFHPLRQGLQTLSKKAILRKELLRWHSDKFDSNVLCCIYPHEKAAVQDAAGVVARLLTDLMREVEN